VGLPLPAPRGHSRVHGSRLVSVHVCYAYIYYVGQQGGGVGPLQCSCLLCEHVEWTVLGPIVHQDPTYPDGACPFDALRELCDEATRDGGLATIVCDDSGGLEQVCSAADYCTGGFIRLASIASGNLIFSDSETTFPWRVLQVIR
jgi:hypothetical protein